MGETMIKQAVVQKVELQVSLDDMALMRRNCIRLVTPATQQPAYIIMIVADIPASNWRQAIGNHHTDSTKTCSGTCIIYTLHYIYQANDDREGSGSTIPGFLRYGLVHFLLR